MKIAVAVMRQHLSKDNDSMVIYRMIRTIFKHELKPRHVFSMLFSLPNIYIFHIYTLHCQRSESKRICLHLVHLLLTVKNVTCSLHVLYHNVRVLNLLWEDRIRVGRVEVISSSPKMYCNVVLLDFHCPVFSSVFVFKAGRNTQTVGPMSYRSQTNACLRSYNFTSDKEYKYVPKVQNTSMQREHEPAKYRSKYQIGLLKYINMMVKSSDFNNCLY